MVAVDAGAMQIQWWEGAALSRAENVLQGTTHDTVRAEIGYGEKVSQRRWSKKLEEGIGLTAGHKDTERLEGRRVFELERVVSCRRADPWWRWISAAVSISMSFRLARNPGTIAIVSDGDSGGSALISDPVARTGALASGAVTRVSELACIEG